MWSRIKITRDYGDLVFGQRRRPRDYYVYYLRTPRTGRSNYPR